jgi:hypothetical protein
MNKWGQQMIDAVTTVAQMAALGYACLASSDPEHMLTPNNRFDLPQDAFTDIMRDGPHLLAPTGAVYLFTIRVKWTHMSGVSAGSDLARYNSPGTVFAGFHYGASPSFY